MVEIVVNKCLLPKTLSSKMDSKNRLSPGSNAIKILGWLYKLRVNYLQKKKNSRNLNGGEGWDT